MSWLENSWYQYAAIRWLLLPLSLLFQSIAYLRKLAYHKGWLRRYKAPVPVIIVGNITVGGTGKTPFVIWLVEQLRAAGYRPGVISRGYGGKASHYPVSVTQDSLAKHVGDEPLLIARRTGCPLVVDPKRSRAAEYLLTEYQCDVIISDDGLQHYALQRDIEIVLVDSQRRFGNKLCLPAGPLREPLSRLKQVDLIIYHGEADHHDLQMTLDLSDCINLNNQQTCSLTQFSEQEVHAVAGIGHPQRFFDQLSAQKLIVHSHPFPDHHRYTQTDLVFAEQFPILMTEKDAVKCMHFANDQMWMIPVNAQITGNVFEQIQNKLKEII